jgi:phospholipid/cholesterol/gamma-HCH transport system substrate-binding protein
MRAGRNETLTGAFVLVTLLVVAGTVIALGAPGLFRSLNTYHVFFDNAGGIKPGTDVLLAGRHVGQVVEIRSPVPVAERPEGHPELEAVVEVRVAKKEKIYRAVTVRMQQYGLLGQEMIDFANGDETSGVAEGGTSFVGERVAGLTDASTAAKEAIEELKKTLVNLNAMTGEGGDLRRTVANAKDFTDTIRREPWRLIWKGKGSSEGDSKKEAKKDDKRR